jgi:hypothetical protein
VAATRSNVDGGEEPNHDGESSGEKRARRGGPKTHRSTTQEAHEPNSHTMAGRQPQKQRRRQESEQATEIMSRAQACLIIPNH